MRVITIDADSGKQVYSRKEVATICGVSAQTIRLWEDADRIPKSMRAENDYRYWDEESLAIVLEYSKNPIKRGRKKKTVE